MNLTELLRQYLACEELNEALLASLTKLIRERIRRSGMWEHPPDYFGYPEYHSWKEAFSEDVPPGPVWDFLLEEIVPDQIFFAEKIRIGNTIDALIQQKIKWFLIDRQKKHDPLGYRVFKNLTAVLEAMIEDGIATATNRIRGKLQNDSHILLKTVASGHLANKSELARLIDTDPEWQAVLRQLGKLGKGAQRLLRARLDRLPSHEVSDFEIKDLVDILKDKVRAAHEVWNRLSEAGSVVSPAGSEKPDDSRTELPDDRYGEVAALLDALGKELPEAVERSEYTLKVKERMLVVFEDWLHYLKRGQAHPPLREWAAQLGLPRASLCDYQQRLRLVMQGILERYQGK